jgi:2-keto-4-pentenoate hydratase/2-oxohepta-3-ene-1,7-dioic acid hydratase in catechol pathway
MFGEQCILFLHARISAAAPVTKFPTPELAIRSFVNGAPRQNANTNQLIFDIPYIIAELSSGMTLKAGTIISTGTPAGVGMGMQPPCFLKKGDVVRCEI